MTLQPMTTSQALEKSSVKQMPAVRVLVVEDEPDLREAMVAYLEMEGLQAEGAGSLRRADQHLAAHAVDVLVLDLGLPDGDGLDWLAARPRRPDQGVVVTTARGEVRERVSGVRAGADIYLVKPVQMEELSTLIHNLAQRLLPGLASVWSLDRMSWQLASPDGRVVKLTATEHALLARLAQSPGLAVSRQELVHSLGHDPRYYDPRRMEILVRRLRNKVRETLGCLLPVETAHGLGYAFTGGVVVRSAQP